MCGASHKLASFPGRKRPGNEASHKYELVDAIHKVRLKQGMGHHFEK